ncbi:MAG: hypothetical protein QY307_06130 [Acidimicrobiia bacterium]|nr:MAG: hypothetical protein QY307_06130 [Acidimicrobiia bacterium]
MAVFAVVAAITFSLIAFIVGMVEEPYHIDELRQAGYYERPISGVIEQSMAQDQPPLDAIIGSVTQKVVGVGDIRQRLHPVVFGVAALILLATLLWQEGLRLGAAAAVLALGTAPLVVSYIAYARPYAFPLFLEIAFVFSATRWLESGRWWHGAVLTVTAMLLPLSRAVEPGIFLFLAFGSLFVFHRLGRLPAGGAALLPLVATGAATLLVAAPVSVALLDEVSAYTDTQQVDVLERLGRLVTDLPAALDGAFRPAWIALAIIVFAGSIPKVRKRLFELWWIWPVALMPLGFAAAFMITARPSQPFYERYAFSWWLPFAVIFGFVTEWAIERSGAPLGRAAVGVTLSAFLAIGAVALVDDLRTDEWGDYEPLTMLVERTATPETIVFFDNVRPLGAYRAGYAGRGRYGTHPGTIMRWVVENPGLVGPQAPFLIALNGPAVEVADWTATEASPGMVLYTPDHPVAGPSEAAHWLVEFGRTFPTADGAYLRIAGAALYDHAGETDRACAEVAALLETDPSLAEVVERTVSGKPLAATLAACPEGA